MDKNKCKKVLPVGSAGIKDDSVNTVKNGPLFFYRLLEYTLLDVLVDEHGLSNASDFLYKAGHKAGLTLAKEFLDFKLDFNDFFIQLSKLLQDNQLGLLGVEEFNLENSTFIFTISEDLEYNDCSKESNAIICRYDEGLIAGVMKAYTGENIIVNEVDCWARGSGCWRFRGAPAKSQKEKHSI